MSATLFTLKDLKERLEDGELDLSLSTLTGDDIPLKHMKQLKKIQALDLSCNVISSLPSELCSSFIHLVKLDLSKNLMTSLPSNIGEISNLKSLDLLGNKLTTLPESFGNLSSLIWLDVRDNPLSAAIRKEAGDCLDDKQCKTCAIRVVKLMDYVRIEREKIRVAEKAKQEAEALELAEQQKAEKKRHKQVEKDRRRQEFLSRENVATSDQPTSINTAEGDAQEKLVKKSLSSTHISNSGGVFATLCGLLPTLLLMVVVSAAILLAGYYYCESDIAPEHVPACCTSAMGLSLRAYMKNNVIPIIELIQDKLADLARSVKG